MNDQPYQPTGDREPEDGGALMLRELYDAWCEHTGAADTPRLTEALHAFVRAIDHPTERHIIEFRSDGWTIQHTLACRVRGDLFACPINLAAQELEGPPARLGRFPVQLDAGRLVVDVPARAAGHGATAQPAEAG